MDALLRELDEVRTEIQTSQNLPQKMISTFDRLEKQIDEYWKKLKLDEIETSIEKAHAAIEKINIQRIDNLILAFKKLNTEFPRYFKQFEPYGKAEFVIQRIPGMMRKGIFREGAIFDQLSPEIAETMLRDYSV